MRSYLSNDTKIIIMGSKLKKYEKLAIPSKIEIMDYHKKHKLLHIYTFLMFLYTCIGTKRQPIKKR